MKKRDSVALATAALFATAGIAYILWKKNLKRKRIVHKKSSREIKSKGNGAHDNVVDKRTSSENEPTTEVSNTSSQFTPLESNILIAPFDMDNVDHDSKRMFASHLESLLLKAYWDAFREDLANGKYDCVVSILREIRDLLSSVAPRNKKFVQEIYDSMDIELFEQVLKSETFDSQYLAQIVTFIVSKIQQLQAPVYDESTKKWVSETIPKIQESHSLDEICSTLPTIFAYIFQRINKIKEEIARFHADARKLRLPVDEVETHRRLFQNSLDRGEITLKLTTAWIERGYKEFLSSNKDHVGDIKQVIVESLVADLILNYATSLDFHNEIRVPLDFPETCLFQIKKIIKTSKEVAMVIEVGTVYLLLYQFFHQEKVVLGSKQDWEELQKQLLHAFSQDRVAGIQYETPNGVQSFQVPLYQPATLDVVATRVKQLTKSIFDKYGYPMHETHLQELDSMVKKRLDKKDPVFVLVQKRIVAAIKDATNIPEKLGRSGLVVFSEDIEAIVRDIQLLGKMNFEVHTENYTALFSSSNLKWNENNHQ